ncbi:uncharacterized protein CDAR_450471 [Caerostris darwini]|uniref:Transposase n=1 Tax=Caerostris darwini TaxID=1538125 RepID=A0AAV4NG96_9ARAC|nr:uncharacterized protein CDAR_450471 [Caerostris darwini]
MPVNTVHKILHNILHCYIHKITHVPELFLADLPVRYTFALELLTRMVVDHDWSWSILWTDEAHFTLQDIANARNCRICATENPFVNAPVQLHFAE